MSVWEKVGNIIIKKINSELIYNKKYLKAGKRFNTKESFQMFLYTSNIVRFNLWKR